MVKTFTIMKIIHLTTFTIIKRTFTIKLTTFTIIKVTKMFTVTKRTFTIIKITKTFTIIKLRTFTIITTLTIMKVITFTITTTKSRPHPELADWRRRRKLRLRRWWRGS
ncbi:uncharacterized protein LOC103513115 isoform X5 [Diaphorina citri]|uniref:Uncharacterized protein LOC103513115 isoform X4 n=1 Tax=Diaphorina citri TaxID=121845 RepID=A0A3Q0J1F4_DIACI|nr:uncharacterized protein LOC103513115 isoform X4 [Diaphorina citri]XP_026682317.1 uncharacterized protein LOC103513115 isoform X5 [Diaphorina citri]